MGTDQKLYAASSATSKASPSQACFSRVGQSVGTNAAMFDNCPAWVMAEILFNNSASLPPPKEMAPVARAFVVVHFAFTESGRASKTTDEEALMITCWKPCHVNEGRSGPAVPGPIKK